MEVSGQLHAPAALPQEKGPWYSLDRRLGGPQSRSGRGVCLKRNIHSPARKSNSDHPIVQPVGQSLYRLSYPSSSYSRCYVSKSIDE
jgi:hypothetical protein